MSYLQLPSYVNDFTGTLNSKVIESYNKKFSEYDTKEGVQIATVFIKHREGRQLKDIALEIFNGNGIGDKETNSGLLLIVVTDEKKIRIMTGKGMEIEFPDSYCRDIIERELRPLLEKRKYKELLTVWYKIITEGGINSIGGVKKYIYSSVKIGENTINVRDVLQEVKIALRNMLIGGIMFLIIVGIISSIQTNVENHGSWHIPNSHVSSDYDSGGSSSYDSDWGGSDDSDWGGGRSNGGGWGD